MKFIPKSRNVILVVGNVMVLVVVGLVLCGRGCRQDHGEVFGSEWAVIDEELLRSIDKLSMDGVLTVSDIDELLEIIKNDLELRDASIDRDDYLRIEKLSRSAYMKKDRRIEIHLAIISAIKSMLLHNAAMVRNRVVGSYIYLRDDLCIFHLMCSGEVIEGSTQFEGASDEMPLDLINRLQMIRVKDHFEVRDVALILGVESSSRRAVTRELDAKLSVYFRYYLSGDSISVDAYHRLRKLVFWDVALENGIRNELIGIKSSSMRLGDDRDRGK